MFIFQFGIQCLINFLNFRASSHFMPRIELTRIKTQDNKMHRLQLPRCFPKRIPFNFHYLMSSVYQGAAQNTHTHILRQRQTHADTHCKRIMVNERHSGSKLFSFVSVWFVCLFCPFNLLLWKSIQITIQSISTIAHYMLSHLFISIIICFLVDFSSFVIRVRYMTDSALAKRSFSFFQLIVVQMTVKRHSNGFQKME